jgi:hypothetical protein
MKDLNQNLLRHHQREELKTDIERMDNMLPHAKGDDRGSILRRRENTKKMLADQSPEPLTGAEKDKLHKLEQKLREKITHNMPSEEVMRKNPVGAVDWHQRWEKANKHAVKLWKNVRIQLNPDNSDRDLANIDRYRPSGQTDRMRTDAQIPGLMSYGDIDEADWPFDAPKNTALEQVKRRYDENLAENDVNAALEELDKADIRPTQEEPTGFGPSGKLSAEQYAALEDRLKKGREALAKKRADQKQLEAEFDALPVEEQADRVLAD